MPVNMRIYGFGPNKACVYLIDLPMVEDHRVYLTIDTARQHARFQGATEVLIRIDE